jgi:hypothetical protein
MEQAPKGKLREMEHPSETNNACIVVRVQVRCTVSES